MRPIAEDMDLLRDILSPYCDSVEVLRDGEDVVADAVLADVGGGRPHAGFGGELGRFRRLDGSLTMADGAGSVSVRLSSGRRACVRFRIGKRVATAVPDRRTPTLAEIEESIRATVPVSQYRPPAAAGGHQLSQPTLL